jgi:DNA-binding XRE family transcriptional regulator
MNKAQFCRAIGIVRNSYQAYASGRREVPLTVALAVAAVMRGLKPWPE